jgi:hypothetical protein
LLRSAFSLKFQKKKSQKKFPKKISPKNYQKKSKKKKIPKTISKKKFPKKNFQKKILKKIPQKNSKFFFPVGPVLSLSNKVLNLNLNNVKMIDLLGCE